MKNISQQSDSKSKDQIKVWDVFIRLFHWSLVLLFFIAYFTEDEWLTLHSIAGYSITALLVLRIIWRFIGSYHGQFKHFVTGPKKVFSYLCSLIQGKPQHYLGHNPAGGAMVITLLLSLLALLITGMAALATQGEGPFVNSFIAQMSADLLDSSHEFLANGVLSLVFIHVAAVILSSFLHKENLILAMLTGRKKPLLNDQTINRGTDDA